MKGDSEIMKRVHQSCDLRNFQKRFCMEARKHDNVILLNWLIEMGYPDSVSMNDNDDVVDVSANVNNVSMDTDDVVIVI